LPQCGIDEKHPSIVGYAHFLELILTIRSGPL
jgi:hypothetical protein